MKTIVVRVEVELEGAEPDGGDFAWEIIRLFNGSSHGRYKVRTASVLEEDRDDGRGFVAGR